MLLKRKSSGASEDGERMSETIRAFPEEVRALVSVMNSTLESGEGEGGREEEGEKGIENMEVASM